MTMRQEIATIPEAQLIKDVLTGNRDAFERLCAPYHRKLLVRASRIVRSREDAKDIVQEALWKSFRALSSFRADCKFETWLTQIVVNEARMCLRHPARQRCVSFSPAIESTFRSGVEDGYHQVAGKERIAALLGGIEALPEVYREVLRLRLNEMNNRQCREHLSISLPALKSRQYRAIHMLRDQLER